MDYAHSRISVIVPCYNVEEYIAKCVDSLISQEYEGEYEIILVDDGSKDGTGGIIDDYAKKDPSIHAFHKENGGLSSARNYGIQHSEGNLITFVDSDDFVSATYLKDLMYLMQKYDADMAITKVVLRLREDDELKSVFQDFAATRKEALHETYCGDRITWMAVGKLFRREIFQDTCFPIGYYEDQASAYQFLSKCNRIAIGDFRNNYYYIQRDGSITFSRFQEKHLRIFEVCDEYARYIQQNYPDLYYTAVMTYQKSVQLLLNRLTMDWRDYREIFCKYRPVFRSNFREILKNQKIPTRYRVYFLVMCTTPICYKLFSSMIRTSQSIQQKKKLLRSGKQGSV
ncbi:MAG: glycosyltransferase [Clostridiales bacterium]|nr:glycosyltransferase [Clostridiales bacterium]